MGKWCLPLSQYLKENVLLRIYKQEQEKDPRAFPSQTDEELGIYESIYIPEKSHGRIYVERPCDVKELKIKILVESMNAKNNEIK